MGYVKIYKCICYYYYYSFNFNNIICYALRFKIILQYFNICPFHAHTMLHMHARACAHIQVVNLMCSTRCEHSFSKFRKVLSFVLCA